MAVLVEDPSCDDVENLPVTDPSWTCALLWLSVLEVCSAADWIG